MNDETMNINIEEEENLISTVLGRDGFIMVNRPLMLALGTDAAIMCGELISEYEYWKQRGEVTPEGYFFSTVENVKNNTGLTAHQQRNAIAKLEEAEILETSRGSVHGKRYIKINLISIRKFLTNYKLKILTTEENEQEQVNIFNITSEKNEQVHVKNFNKTYNKNNIIKITNNNSITNVIECETEVSPVPSKPKKETYKTVIDELILDESAKTAIYEYTTMIKNAFGFPLPVKQLRTKIEDTLKLTNYDIEYFIEIFKNATDNCYKKLVDTRKNNGRSYQQPQKPFKSVFDDVVNPYTGEKCGDVPPEVLDCFDFSKPLDGFGF